MNTAQPIRNKQDLERFTDYYKDTEKNPRNQLLIIMGLNTALRISDLLALRWENVYDKGKGKFRGHISLVESKTGKASCIFMNQSIRDALQAYRKALKECTGRICGEAFLFAGHSGAPISRVQAYRIIRKAAESCELTGVISPHSLRKTFGYYAWKQGTPPALLMEIYHHSSFAVTQRYLGIEQDDRDEVFKNLCL
ncbi:MAG: tyrosine-type recombinase/integrase [Roseburia sp.]|nr:tyrosine-type recombinase/integrase [Roseburia sp.]